MNMAELAAKFEIDWFDHQLAAIEAERMTDPSELRACLYYATGKGKTRTALAILVQAGVTRATVVAPPRTHAQWKSDGAKAGIELTTISHALYRQKGRKFSRLEPFIVDEFHMLGGASGAGWEKMRVQARGMLAPLLILSATPNYNDVERVYCVEHVLSPHTTQGGFIAWIYQHCITEENPFARTPNVVSYLDGRPAKEHLAEMPHVYYVEDPYEDFPVVDVQLDTSVPDEFDTWGLNRRDNRIVASLMERRAASRKLQLLDDDGLLKQSVYDELIEIAGASKTPILVFCARSTIARGAHDQALQHGAKSALVSGDVHSRIAEDNLRQFKKGRFDVLFGTATMATGVDGLDKVCNTLVLLDDTEDDSLRRQLVGRILPRGGDTDVSNKLVVRFVLGTPV